MKLSKFIKELQAIENNNPNIDISFSFYNAEDGQEIENNNPDIDIIGFNKKRLLITV